MDEDFEEIPPYEEWTVKDLKAELSARGLNNAGKKSECVERLYMDDDIGVDEVEEDEPEGGSAELKSDGRGWVDNGQFFIEFVEDLGRDDFNSLPLTPTHNRLLVESFDAANRYGDVVAYGGPYDGQLSSKTTDGKKVTYVYCVNLRK